MKKKEDKAIRNQYSELGVENYYLKHGADYINPHFQYVKQLVEQNQERLDYSKVLDFCCGGGEVSMVLRDLGFTNTVGSDPFTQKAFEKNLHKTCLPYSFQDVIKGKLAGEFSTIICSFAMHLCPEKELYPLVHNLFKHSPCLVIITPHKRPRLEDIEGVSLAFEDFTLTWEKGKKVRLKAYALG